MAAKMDYDVNLHPAAPGTTSVSQFELESLYEAHSKTCVQLTHLKDEHQALLLKNDEVRAELEASNTQLTERSVQLEEEKLKMAQLSLQLLQQFFLNGMLLARGSERPKQLQDGWTQSAQTHPLTTERGQESQSKDDWTQTQHLTTEIERGPEGFGELAQTMGPAQEVQPLVGPISEGEERETELREKLGKIEANYDLILRKNKSMTREMAKLTSKLRILSDENREDPDMDSGVTIRKQGRFMVQRRELECDHCRLGFDSREEAEHSACTYHKMNAVPQDGPDGRKLYWLCCSQAVSGKGQANGCFTGRHRLSCRRPREE